MPLHLVRFPTSTGHMMVAATGLRDTKGSLDTLKKLTKGSPGYWQILPARCVASWVHLEWCVLHVLESHDQQSSRYRNPELALLSQIAGDPQWEKALEIAGLKPTDKEVIVVWFGKADEAVPKSVEKIMKEWGLKSKTVAWGTGILVPPKSSLSKESFAIESSALTELN